MRIYLAGPMRGKPNLNIEAFRYYAALLRSEGHKVYSPVELAEYEGVTEGFTDNPYGVDAQGKSGRKIFAQELAWICEHADAIALMPGWEKSKGATAEKVVAEALSLNVRYL